MEHPFGIVFPESFADQSGIVRVRPRPILTPELPADALPLTTPRLVVYGRGPSFEDQCAPLFTEEELHALVPGPPTPFSRLVELVSKLPFPAAMRSLAWLQREVATLSRTREAQIGAAHELYGREIGAAFERFTRRHERGVIISEPQLFALQRLAVLHARDVAATEELGEEGMTLLKFLLLVVPGTVLCAADDDLSVVGSNPPTDPGDDDWLRFFVGTGGTVVGSAIDHAIARSRLLFRVIARSRAARRHADFIDVDAWIQDEYGFDLVEMEAIGLLLFGLYSKTLHEGPPLLAGPELFENTSLASRTRKALQAVAASREWYRNEFLNSPQTARRAARDVVPFLLRPALLQDDGRAAVISARSIEAWLSATGVYWRLWHIAKRKSKEILDQFFRFHGFLLESYTHYVACASHPNQNRRRRVGATGIVHTEVHYRHEGDSKTSDVVLDYGQDIVLIEVTAKRYTIPSLLEADVETIHADLKAMVVENVRQVTRVVRHLAAGTVSVPGVRRELVKRYWPVIVIPESPIQSPTFWRYLERQAGGYFEQAAAVVGSQLQPLIVLELEEYERLMGIAAETGLLTRALERKTNPVWRERDFKSWHTGDVPQLGSGESQVIQAEWRRANREVRRVLWSERRGPRQQRGREAA